MAVQKIELFFFVTIMSENTAHNADNYICGDITCDTCCFLIGGIHDPILRGNVPNGSTCVDTNCTVCNSQDTPQVTPQDTPQVTPQYTPQVTPQDTQTNTVLEDFPIIPYILDRKTSRVLEYVADAPQLGPYFEKKILSGEIRLNKEYPICPKHGSGRRGILSSLREQLLCNDCLSSTEEIKLNKGISGKALLMFSNPPAYSNPNIWDEIKGDEKLLAGLNEHDFARLCDNPLTIEYVNQHPKRINERAAYNLFNNPAAVNYIIEQKFTGRVMVDMGAKHKHFFPYFDLEYCEAILTGRTRNVSLLHKFFENEAMVDMVYKHLKSICAAYGDIAAAMAEYPHNLFIIEFGLGYFWQNPSFPYFISKNPAAIPFLRKNSELIVFDALSENPNGVRIMEKYIEFHHVAGLDIAEGWLEDMCKHPLAIEFILEHPEFMSDDIYENPAIFTV